MANPNLQELPQLRTPKERAQEEITEYGEWMASTSASKLFTKRRYVPEMILRIREFAEMIAEYDKTYNPPQPMVKQSITRTMTVKEEREPEFYQNLERAMGGTR